MQADILAGILLDLLVELDRVFLQLGNVRITIDRVHAARRMPGGAGGQLRTLQKHHIGPAELGQVVQDRTPDDTPADDDDTRMALHGKRSLGGKD